MLPSATKKNFLIFWLSGWALLFIIRALQPSELTGIMAGLDMEAHRRAGNASMVDTIHAHWQEKGVYSQALWSLVVDLFFITVISIGGILGGRLLQQDASANIRRVGLLAIIAHIAFWLVDYAETLSQLVQMVQGQGDDMLAGIAAFMRPIKMQLFLIGFAALVIGYIASRVIAARSGAKS
ncbi:MAG: hypothetical protein AAGH53_09085 [Pseudomonadota bacterium]